MVEYGFPFAAVVGQEQCKRALIYNIIDPKIGGVLLCGEKGTAKSTIVRALAALGGMQVVDLPLSITEDMLVGSIDFEAAVRYGERRFSGGVLAKAHGNLLYVDEVNLLPDGIVSTLICASANGENIVEREGISFRHACRFSLVGTMNPEEGKLRPQFLDRFGLYVSVTGESDVEQRAQIARRRLEYEKDPVSFARQYAERTLALREQIGSARKRVGRIVPDAASLSLACEYARQAGTEGNRCEIILIETAKAVAAFAGREYLNAQDILEAARYVLPHRRRQFSEEEPQEQPGGQDDKDDTAEQPPQPESADGTDAEKEPKQNPEADLPGFEQQNSLDEPSPEQIETSQIVEAAAGDDLVYGQDLFASAKLQSGPRDRRYRVGSGRRHKTRSGANRGRYAAYTSRRTKAQRDIALDATLRAAAPYQTERERSDCMVSLVPSDLRFKIRETHVGATIVFVVDASGSMGAARRMKEAKEAVLSMLFESYQKRDKVGLIAFCRGGAEVLLDITSSVDLAQKRLQQLPTGGKTPLADGLFCAWQLIKARRLKDPELLPILVLVTDGRANQGLWSDDPLEDALQTAQLVRSARISAVVVDTEKDYISLHIAQRIAQAMNAVYFKVEELRSEHLTGAVKVSLPASIQNGGGRE